MTGLVLRTFTFSCKCCTSEQRQMGLQATPHQPEHIRELFRSSVKVAHLCAVVLELEQVSGDGGDALAALSVRVRVDPHYRLEPVAVLRHEHRLYAERRPRAKRAIPVCVHQHTTLHLARRRAWLRQVRRPERRSGRAAPTASAAPAAANAAANAAATVRCVSARIVPRTRRFDLPPQEELGAVERVEEQADFVRAKRLEA
eukprot:3793171-Pleurochrysis_carterae.AAC.2